MKEFRTWGIKLVEGAVTNQYGADLAAGRLDTQLNAILQMGYEIFSIVPLSTKDDFGEGGLTMYALVTGVRG